MSQKASDLEGGAPSIEEISAFVTEDTEAQRKLIEDARANPSLALSDRHPGVVSNHENRMGERLSDEKKSFLRLGISKREFLLTLGLGSLGAVLGGLALDGVYELKDYFNPDDYTEDGDAPSPAFSRAILQSSYNSEKLNEIERTSKGDERLWRSINAHRSFDLLTVRNNLMDMLRSLKLTTHADGRFALIARILLDANLVGEEKIVDFALSLVNTHDIQQTFAPDLVLVKIIDYASTATLSLVGKKGLLNADGIRFATIYDLVRRVDTNPSASKEQLAQAYGLEVFTLIQAHHLRMLSSRDDSPKKDFLSDWLDDIVHIICSRDTAESPRRLDIVEDGIYSLTRLAFFSELSGHGELSRHVVATARGKNKILAGTGADLIRDHWLKGARRLPINQRWLHLLRTSQLVRDGNFDGAKKALNFINSSGGKTGNLSFDKTLNDMNRLILGIPHIGNEASEVPDIIQHRAYMDAISLDVETIRDVRSNRR